MDGPVLRQFATPCALLPALFAPIPGASSSPITPVAEFAETSSEIAEQNGRIELTLALSREFSGEVAYRVDGSAEQGADYESGEFVLATVGDGRELRIVIDLFDDDSIEEEETIRVTLQPGEEYQLNSARQHTVSIRDNDAQYMIIQEADGMTFDYGLQVIRNGDTTHATATSNGMNGLPPGSHPAVLKEDNESFVAIIGPIKVAADQTLLGVDLNRSFTLVADRPLEDEEGEHGSPLIGSFTESMSVEGFPGVHPPHYP